MSMFHAPNQWAPNHWTANQRQFRLNPMPPPPLTPLRAGPLSLYLGEGDLRYIRLGQQEVIRRIYVAVRDQNWGTIPYELHDINLHDGVDEFTVEFVAQHREAAIAFDWHGSIHGSSDGHIRFTMDGMARSTFLRNRIGFCILHPAACAGMPCTAEHTDGRRQDGRLPDRIAPHQPFLDLRAFTLRQADGANVETRFDGDIFEMEDQRNWTDASFKIYSTPLDLPFPVAVHQDDRVQQAVTVAVHNRPDAATPETADVGDASAQSGPAPVNVTVSPQPLGNLPALGLGAAPGQSLDAHTQELLAQLQMDHIRVDLLLSSPNLFDRLAHAVAQAQALQTRLEIALFGNQEPEAALARIAPAIDDRRFQNIRSAVARWLVFSTTEPTSPTHLVQQARQELNRLTPNAPIGGGTNLYFTELNRFPPTFADLDCVAYSLNPQVHAFDTLSLVESLQAQPMTSESAKHLAGDKPLVISPITLRPRFNPHQTLATEDHTAETNGGGSLPASVDIRQPSLFAAAWTLGSLATLAPGPVEALTYYELTGLRGVMVPPQGVPDTQQFPVEPNELYPVYHIFAALNAFKAAPVLSTQVDAPLRLTALAIQNANHRRILLGNLTPEPLAVNLRGAAPTDIASAAVHPGSEGDGLSGTMQILDEGSLEQARHDPTFFAGAGAAAPIPHMQIDEPLTLELAPYAVAAIDVPLP